MKLLKQIPLFAISLVVYWIALTAPFTFIPPFVSSILNLFALDETTYSMIASVLFTLIAFFISSDCIYAFLHKHYCRLNQKCNSAFGKYILVALISANDVIVAFPKRTLLFTIYLIITILDKLGYLETHIDVLFVGVVIIGIDRVVKSWNTEKQKMFALGTKVYSDSGDIKDSIV